MDDFNAQSDRLLEDNGCVYGPQISTDLRPPRTAYSSTPAYVVTEETVPDYDDWAYLPDYGYDTYWYGDVPIFFYNVAVWRWCHPWWWWHGCQAWWWHDGFHGRRAWDPHSFSKFAMNRGVNFATAQHANMSALNRMGRTTRSASIASSNVNRFNANRFNGNRSNIRSSNINRFNANRFPSGSNNAFRSRTFSSSNRFHSGSMNTFHPRTFSAPHAFRSGNLGGRSFSGIAGSRGFSRPSFGSGSFHAMGGGRHR